MLKVSPADQAGTVGKAGSQFTGAAFPYVTMRTTDGVTINTVVFTPGARTHWHAHERGQILQIVAGRGLIQSEGEEIHELLAGDVVWVPAGERHWHGAAPEAYMTHVAISLGATDWAHAVTDGEYRRSSREEA